MQERIKSSRSGAIPMMGQLLHHGQPEDWLVRSVYQHVNSYESEKQFPLLL